MFDLHCHYLPGVDDGARTLDEGLQLAAAAVANGVRGAILTPHLHPGRYENTRSTLIPRFAVFRRELSRAGIDLDIRLGCELRLSGEMFELLERGQVPMLGAWRGRPVVLLEFPHDIVPIGALRAAVRLTAVGCQAMIAHPERNKTLMRDPIRLEPFVEAGCLAQLTAASVIGRFGGEAQRASHAMIERDWVTVVASDAHSLAHRPPLMREARDALSARYGEAYARRLTEEAPRIIFEGRATVARPTQCTR